MYLLASTLSIHDPRACVVAYFHHGLRSEDADADGMLVHEYTKNHGGVYVSTQVDIRARAQATRKGLEETGRIERYAWLRRIRREYGARYILTAHHRDDLVETMLFNIVRGARLGGLGSLREVSGSILRPLLDMTKPEILSIVESEHIPYRHDVTNDDTRHLRNYLRHEIIP